MQFSGKQTEVFRKACDEYAEVIGLLKRESIFHEEQVNKTAMLRFDYTLQKMLVAIAIADGEIEDEEHQFILSVCDHVEEQNEISAGFKRFLKYFTVENAKPGLQKYFSGYSLTDTADYFVKHYFQVNASQNWEYMEGKMTTICRCMIAIDGRSLDVENDCLAAMLQERGNIEVGAIENKPQVSLVDNENLDNAVAELNNLIGLNTVKAEVGKRLDLIRFNQLIREMDGDEAQTSTLSLHMVFTGAPGTGKSTVAVIIGKIYKELGVLSQGHLVKVGRDDLIAEYEGQTATKMASVIRSAKGGILFIDEAYALVEKNNGANYGQEAIDTLVKYMEEMRDDLIVIVAGYEDEMNEFVKANKGLPSRFRKYIHFEDYSAEEMYEIFESICKNTPEKMTLDPACKPVLVKYFSNFVGDNTFANGRGVRNTFEGMHEEHASRVGRLGLKTKEEVKTYTLEDLEGVIESGLKSKDNHNMKQKIGFYV